MTAENLDSILRSNANHVEYFRNNDIRWEPYVFEKEYTNWIEEQRAIWETSAIVDQSYHMEVLEITGPEAVDFLGKVGVNDLDKFRHKSAPQAVNLVCCNPDGYVIGDAIVFHVGDDQFHSLGAPWTHNWLKYNSIECDYETEVDLLYDPFEEEDPPDFRFQIQGPYAMDVVEDSIDDSLPDIPFFQMDTIQIDGLEINALRHGMAGTPGLEIFADYEYHDEVLDRLLAVGESYQLRRIGSKAYKTGKIGSGWFNASVPAIYSHEELERYRKWLGPDSAEAQLSIGGSYVSADIEDYYMTPMERGQGQLVDLDHEFIGRDALEDMIDNQQRARVTLVWDPDDVVDVYASLFRDGETKKFIPLPDTAHQWSVAHYDQINKDGAEIGVSKYPGYLYYKREMLSLASVDIEHSDPGTSVSFIWGEDTKKSKVERHQPTEIRATVAEAPYVRGGRR